MLVNLILRASMQIEVVIVSRQSECQRQLRTPARLLPRTNKNQNQSKFCQPQWFVFFSIQTKCSNKNRFKWDIILDTAWFVFFVISIHDFYTAANARAADIRGEHIRKRECVGDACVVQIYSVMRTIFVLRKITREENVRGSSGGSGAWWAASDHPRHLWLFVLLFSPALSRMIK